MSNVYKSPCDEGVIRCGKMTAPCTRWAGRFILTATILGSSMAIIDSTAVNVALPVFQAELGATVSEVQWIVESYALFLSALILVGGSLGDRFGRRRLFVMGVALFAVASAACGLAGNPAQLIWSRGVQGIGGALMMPGSLAILSSSFSEQERGRVIGTWSAFTAISAALGPVLGGWLVQNWSWRWIFFINLPLAGIVLAISFHCVPESRTEIRSARFDWTGTFLAVIGLGFPVFGLIESANLGWKHPLVFGSLIVGLMAQVGFVLVERRSPAPIMPLSLFRSRTFTGANLLTFLLYAALSGALFFLPFNLIQVQGYSPTAAGASMLPLILSLFFLSRWAGGLVNRFGARLPLIVGPILAGIGFALFSMPEIGGGYWGTFFPGIGVLGLGMAISVAPLTTTVMNSVKTDFAGIASGINNAVARTAGLLAIAIFGVFALNTFNRELDNHLGNLRISSDLLEEVNEQRMRLAGMEIPLDRDPELRIALERAIDGAFVEAFRLIAWIAAGLAASSAIIAFLMIERGVPIRRPP